jgi:prolyl-tRNA editing enzyme YbaK/EbsC (Cys-tRNA(Pro) deacylase)
VRSCDDVHDELAANGIPHEMLQLSSSSRTAELAAEALGVDVADVVKSLLFVLDDERPVLALVTGDATVDADALARAMGASEVRLAGAREVRESTATTPVRCPRSRWLRTCRSSPTPGCSRRRSCIAAAARRRPC